MNNKLLKIFPVEFLKENKFLENCLITHIVYDPTDDVATFSLQTNKILLFEQFQKIQIILIDTNSKMKIKIVPTDLDYDNIILEKYIAGFLKNYDKENFSNKISVRGDCRHNKVYFNIEKNFSNDSWKTFAKNVNFFLDTAGFPPINILFNFLKNEETSERQKIIENIPVVEPKKNPVSSSSNNNFWLSSMKDNVSLTKIGELKTGMFQNVKGQIFRKNVIRTRTGATIFSFAITDFEKSVYLKLFTMKPKDEEYMHSFNVGDCIMARVNPKFDTFLKEDSGWINKIIKISSIFPKENVSEKEERAELSIHTNMSTLNGISSFEKYITKAVARSHKAIGITDLNSVQSFSLAENTVNKLKKDGKNIKMIYGAEVNILPEELSPLINYDKHKTRFGNSSLSDCTYISFDLETTGLSPQWDEIIEFAAVKVVKGTIVEKISFFIKNSKPIPKKIFLITGISEDMTKQGLDIEEALQKIKDFFGNDIIVAHNAKFDVSFLEHSFLKNNIEWNHNLAVDTLQLSRFVHSSAVRHQLGNVARKYKITYDEEIAHRALQDSLVLSQVLSKLLADCSKKNIQTIEDLQNVDKDNLYTRYRNKSLLVYAKNQHGLKELYKIISIAHTKYFFGTPSIPKNILKNFKNVYVTNSDFNSEMYEVAFFAGVNELEKIIEQYDWVSLHPILNFTHLISRDVLAKKDIISAIHKIIDIAKKKNKLIISSGGVYHCEKNEKVIRDIIIETKGIGGKTHYLYSYNDKNPQYPDSHFRTQAELMECFSFLKDKLDILSLITKNVDEVIDKFEDIVISNEILSFPIIENAENLLSDLSNKKLMEVYGENPPLYVSKRYEEELKMIKESKYSVIYYIAHLLVKFSVENKYIVGSRGSVGSSFLAFLCGITDVNPLQAHYICDNCKHSEFMLNETTVSGFDLSSKNCSKCKTLMRGDGQNIPFETFLGFKGESKIPDIDLNFSGDFQIKAHNFIKDKFGENHVYRAGTISTVAERTAFGYVKSYLEKHNLHESVSRAELDRLVAGCVGIKRTTGQHPGAIIIIPKDNDIFDYTPYNYPADDKSSDWYTTHLDFHSLEKNLLKLDILGHDDPTVVKKLSELTNIDVKTIPNHDEKVMSLFSSNKNLNLEKDILNDKTGAIAIPEFGTPFVRGILSDTKPHKFSHLIQISGLSHGTGVWLNNARELIVNKQIVLEETISCRDDIMTFLIKKGLGKQKSFRIMENVRKGKGITKEEIKKMKEFNIPDWYINSCIEIKYLFPKAHAAAYVLMAWRFAWFKYYYPLEFYATYFSTRSSVFEIEIVLMGKDKIKQRTEELSRKQKSREKPTPKESELAVISEVILEMYYRGYVFENVDIKKSKVSEFIINMETNALILPFNTIPGLGVTAAESIVAAREEKEISSIEDFKSRTSVNKTVMGKMKQFGCFEGLPEAEQLKIKLEFQ